MTLQKTTREYKAYKILQHWKRAKKTFPPEELFDKKNLYYPLFQYLFKITKDLYSDLPKRKNGEKAFVHPINIVLALKEANITDEIVLCGGLIHDYVEEKVDIAIGKLMKDNNETKNKNQKIKETIR